MKRTKDDVRCGEKIMTLFVYGNADLVVNVSLHIHLKMNKVNMILIFDCFVSGWFLFVI